MQALALHGARDDAVETAGIQLGHVDVRSEKFPVDVGRQRSFGAVEIGAKLLVIGAGPVGLCTIAALRAQAATVDLLAHRPRRMEAGERVGARASVSDHYDVVLDAAGTQSSVDKAVELARPGGTVGFLGTFWDPVSIGVGFQMKEITLVPAFAYGHHHGASEFEEAVRVLGAVPELPDAVVTHHFSLDDAAQAFRVAGDRGSDAIKVVVHP